MTMGFILPKVIFLVTSLAGYAFALRAVAVFVYNTTTLLNVISRNAIVSFDIEV